MGQIEEEEDVTIKPSSNINPMVELQQQQP